MKKVLLKLLQVTVLLLVVFSSLEWAEAAMRKKTPAQAANRQTLRERSLAWEKRWLRTPHRRHTDSSPFQTASTSSKSIK